MNHANGDHLISYAGYHFPPEVISYAAWLYFRFPLSLRMVAELLAARSIDERLRIGHSTARAEVSRPGKGFEPRANPSFPGLVEGSL